MAKPGNLTVKPLAGKLTYDTEIFGKMVKFLCKEKFFLIQV